MSVVAIAGFRAEGGWEHEVPGPELGARLARTDVSRIADVDLIDALAAARQEVWQQSVKVSLVAELVRRRRARDEALGLAQHSSHGSRAIDAEVSLALTLTKRAAGALVLVTEQLVEDLPLTLAALRAGLIDLVRAKVIADGVFGLPAELRRAGRPR